MGLLTQLESAAGAAASNIEKNANEVVTDIVTTAGEIATAIQKALPPPFGPGPTKTQSSVSESKTSGATAPVTTPSSVHPSEGSSPAGTILPSPLTEPPLPSTSSSGEESEPTSSVDSGGTSSQAPQVLPPPSSSVTILDAGGGGDLPTTASSHDIAPSLSAGPPTSPSAVQPENHTADKNKGFSSPGALAGTVVGGLVASGVLVVFIMFLLKWRRRRRHSGEGFSPMATNRTSRSTVSTWMDESSYGAHPGAAAPLVRDSVFDTPAYSAAAVTVPLVRESIFGSPESRYSTHSSDSLASGATLGEPEQYTPTRSPINLIDIVNLKNRPIAGPVPAQMRTTRPSTPLTYGPRETPPPSYRVAS